MKPCGFSHSGEAAPQSVGQSAAFDAQIALPVQLPRALWRAERAALSPVLTHSVTFASPELPEAGPPLLHSAGREGRSEQHPAFFTSSHAVTPCLSCSQQHLPGNPFPAAPRWSFKRFERLSLKFLHRNHCLMFSTEHRREGGGKKPACL